MPSPMAGPIELTARDVHLRGSLLARGMLRVLGWQLRFDGLPTAQGVAVVYPHTSNWDFVIGMLAKWGIGLPVMFWAKSSLFRIPLLGRWIHWLGGRPVLRDAPGGAVRNMVQAMRRARDEGSFLWLALAPEGTRGRTPGWRTGFFRVAHDAAVPVALVTLDYGRRSVGFDSFWTLSGNLREDFAVFSARLAECRGWRPHLAAPVQPLDTPSHR